MSKGIHPLFQRYYIRRVQVSDMGFAFGKDKELEKKKLVVSAYPSLSSLDLDGKKKQNELQKAVVAFDPSGGGRVLAYQGDCFEGEIDALGGYDADELGITDKNAPDNGIWIWEGYFRYHQDWEGEWDCSTSTERWREPTNDELRLIAKGGCPFVEEKEDRDQRLIQMIGRANRPEPPCPKCNSEVVKNRCVSCGFSS